MPEFSVIIPTRRRHDTLRSALQTAVAQDHPDTEIIVHEAGDDPLTAEVVAEVGDERTRHLKTGSDVPMSENWELAVANAKGRYLTVIGDDDGLVPSACSDASRVLDRYPADLLTWRSAAYFWPESLVVGHRNRLHAHLPRPGALERQDPCVLLELAYRFRSDHYTMPMILHSFVSRELVDRIRRSLGKYFHSTAPDIASGVVNALYGTSCILIHRPVSISGMSHNSTGSRLHFTRETSLRRVAEKAAFDELTFHPSLPNTRNGILFAANEMLMMKQRIFPNTGPAINYTNLVQRALDSLAAGLEDYETCLEDIRRTAALNGVDMNRFLMPSQRQANASPPRGVTTSPSGALYVDVDCSREGVSNVADAAHLLGNLLPPLVVPSELPHPTALVRCLEPGTVDFSSGGNGAMALGTGWAQAEEWGVWSVAKKADITFNAGHLHAPTRIRIEGRIFVHPRFPRASGSVEVNGRWAARFEASWPEPRVVLDVVVLPEDALSGTVRIEFAIDEPRSPASSGLGDDTRHLGLGLERLIVA